MTITDVAHEAGVSKTTVSYVISNNPRISKDTADRVRQAMRKLGYTVNHTARALSTSKTMTIGLQVNADDNMKVSLTRGAYLCELSDCARKQGYDLLLLSHHNGMQSIRDIANSRKVDGLILMDIDRADPRIPVAVESEVPTVLLGIPENPMGLDEVDTDFERAAHELIDLFTEQHHQEIALLHTPEGTENGGRPVSAKRGSRGFRQRNHLARSLPGGLGSCSIRTASFNLESIPEYNRPDHRR